MADHDPPPPARRILDTLTAYQRSAALACALELDLFTKVDAGARTAAEVAAACGVAERGAHSLCDFLVTEGFLRREGEGYALDPETGPLLSRRSKRSIASVVTFLYGPTMRGSFDALPEAVRRGTTALPGHGTMEAEHQAWVDFARGMAPLMAPQADALAALLAEQGLAPARVLDVASGHGLYGLAAARRWSRAHVTLQDWAPVLAVARENTEAAGLIGRVDFREGDAFQVDLGGPYDLVQVTQFLHHFPRARCLEFLVRLREAMAPGATLAVLEFLIEPEPDAPTHPLRFSLVLLATTAGGDSFTEAGFRELLDEAGYRDVRTFPLLDTHASAVLARAP